MAVADGSEELETVTIIDTLRRANIEVNVSKVGDDESLECIMSRGVKLVRSFIFIKRLQIADSHLMRNDTHLSDMIVLPGGLQGAVIILSNNANIANVC